MINRLLEKEEVKSYGLVCSKDKGQLAYIKFKK